jgi:hypothetical protein
MITLIYNVKFSDTDMTQLVSAFTRVSTSFCLPDYIKLLTGIEGQLEMGKHSGIRFNQKAQMRKRSGENEGMALYGTKKK